MSVFHWHLADDQGWRIEIPGHPELTDIGSVRKLNTSPMFYSPKQYYSTEDVGRVVEYASRRYILVLPEIECPGYVSALLASHPEVGCTGGPYEVETRHGVIEDVLCIGKDNTYELFEDIIREVARLFPGPYIHLGGDECHSLRWKDCPDCRT